MKKIGATFFWHFCTGGIAFGVFGGFFNSLDWTMKLMYLLGYCLINVLLLLGFRRLTARSGRPE